MVRLRAVPSTVWTAVGALAVLASTGLGVVLGAGLHVWTGPAATFVGAAVHHPRGTHSGLVTVPGTPVAPSSASTPGTPVSGPVPATPTTVVLPAAPAEQPSTGQPRADGEQPGTSTPVERVARPGRLLHGLGAALRRDGLVGRNDLDSTGTVHTLKNDARAGQGRHGHAPVHNAHPHGHHGHHHGHHHHADNDD